MATVGKLQSAGQMLKATLHQLPEPPQCSLHSLNTSKLRSASCWSSLQHVQAEPSGHWFHITKGKIILLFLFKYSSPCTRTRTHNPKPASCLLLRIILL